MATRLPPVRFGNSQKLVRMSLGLCGGALMLAAAAQPGFAATTDTPLAIVSSPDMVASPNPASTSRRDADVRAETTPARVRPQARANPPTIAPRPRVVRTAAMVHRLRRAPTTVSATPYRTGCTWFSCGGQMSWLFLGIGF